MCRKRFWRFFTFDLESNSGLPELGLLDLFCHKMCIIHEIENAEKAYSPFTRNVVGKRENWIDYFLFSGQRGEGT